MKLDQFYTPADVCALAYSSWVTSHEGIRIGDFACGNGALLELAPFPNKTIYGLDIDSETIRTLRQQNPKWFLHAGDFLNPDNNTSRFLEPLRGSLDLVVLNPPFSCRGGSRFEVVYNQRAFSCSIAMAFLVKALEFVKPDGSAMAIMPRSVLKAVKDALALDMIRDNWTIDLREEFPRTTFNGCHPQSCCLSLNRQPAKKKQVHYVSPLVDVESGSVVSIVRGSIPIYETEKSGYFPILHTTELRHDDPISAISRFSRRPGRTVRGHFVTIPRVGVPDLRKVRQLFAKETISLSDCVFALQVDNGREAVLRDEICFYWEHLEAEYASTCAPYITIAQLSHFLSSIGWTVQISGKADKASTGVSQGLAYGV